MKILSSIVIALALCLNSWADAVERSPDGCVKIGGLKFNLVLCRPDWSTAEQGKPGVVSFLGEGGENTPDGLRRDGEFRLTDTHSLRLTEIVQNRAPHGARIQYILSSEPGAPAELFAYQTAIPLERYLRTPARVDGTPVTLPEKQSQVSSGGSVFQIPCPGGILEIKGKKRQIIVTRVGRSVRIRLVFGYKGWKRAHLDLLMRYVPYEAKHVDMSSVMNMGFRDDVAEDRKGGWTDQGPDNDLSAMKSGRQTMNGISFQIVDPQKNHGKSCLAMKGNRRPYFVGSASIRVPEYSGRYLYLLNALAWAPPAETPAGKVIVHYKDGAKQTVLLKCGVDTGNSWNPRDLKNAKVVWKARNGSASIGLYATRIPLEEKNVTVLEFVSENQVWMILAATIGIFEDTIDERKDIVMRRNKDWVPLPYHFGTEKDSVADLSFLLDAPAGKHGFLNVKGDRFEFEKKPGSPVRFWGCNIAEGVHWFEQEADTRKMLDEIAARGYNILRLHHFDFGLTDRSGAYDAIIPERLKKMDFLFAEAKKRGIYLTLDLMTLRWPKIPKYKQLNPGDYKILCYFDRETRNDLIRFSKELLGHVNPYTGTSWGKDPALALVNLINEGTLSIRANRLNKRCRPVVEAAFAEYASRRSLTVTKENRQRHFEEFLTYTGKEFFDEMKKELASIGVRIPLSDQNFARPTPNTREHFDYVDTHFYWCHPVYIGKKVWTLPSYTSSASPIAASAGGIRDVFGSRLDGKPMVISEWNGAYPNPHVFEVIFLTAGYAAFQDYSALIQFCFAGGANSAIEKPVPLGAFLLVNNPLHKLASLAGAMLFLRGDVSPSKAGVLTTAKAAGSIGAQLPLILRVGQLSRHASGRFPVIAAPTEAVNWQGRTIFRKDRRQFFQELERETGIPSDSVLPDGTVVSSTGELLLNPGKEQFRIMTRRSEAALAAPGQRLDGTFLRIRNGNSPVAVFAGSVDGKSLPESRRIMILHLTDIKAAGAVFGDKDCSILKDFGSSQQLLRRNTVQVELAYPDPCRVYACDYSGKRLYRVPVERKNKSAVFTLDNFARNQAVLLYELTRTDNDKN